MLLSNYKRLSYAGILLSAALIICETALMTDDSGLNIDLGIGFDILWGVLLVLMFVFFLLPFFYVRSYNKKLFISVIVIGIIVMIIPAFISGDNITNWLKPKESTFWNYFDLFKISEFRKQINNIEKIIFLCLFICQLLVFMLTFKVKKALKGTKRIDLTDSGK